MKLDEYIDDFIRKEKQEQPNPFLATQILARLEEASEPVVVKRVTPVWQKIAVAACMVLMIGAGVGLGNFGAHDKNYVSININDAQMENLNLYTSSSYE